jgi:hypothetical protein
LTQQNYGAKDLSLSGRLSDQDFTDVLILQAIAEKELDCLKYAFLVCLCSERAAQVQLLSAKFTCEVLQLYVLQRADLQFRAITAYEYDQVCLICLLLLFFDLVKEFVVRLLGTSSASGWSLWEVWDPF